MIDLLRLFPEYANGQSRRELSRTSKIKATRRRQCIKYTVRGERLLATEIAQRAGISYQAVIERAKRGWPHDALDLPPGSKRPGSGEKKPGKHHFWRSL